MQFSFLNEFILAIITGAVQGLTEFLPISSTAHIRLITGLITNGRDIGLTSSNVIQLGTLIAVLQYFRNDLFRYITRLRRVFLDKNTRNQFVYNVRAWLSNQEQFNGSKEQIETDVNMIQLLVGTLPLIAIAIVFGNFAEASRGLQNIAVYLLAGSVLMYFGDYMHKLAAKQQDDRPYFMTVGEVVLVGLFQSLAIFPGISRSGATIAGALMLGRKRAESVRFSFLLSIPAIFLAGSYDTIRYIIDFLSNPNFLPMESTWTLNTISLSLVTLLCAVVVAYLVGLACLKWLIKYLSDNSTLNFIIYRVVVALTILFLVGINLL